MMQVLVGNEVWLGKPGFDTLTYDHKQVDALPERWEHPLIDAEAHHHCLAAWADGNRWCWALVDVENTIVRGCIVNRHGRVTVVPQPPDWWLSDDDLRKLLPI